MSSFIPDYRTVAGDRDYEDVRVVAKDITDILATDIMVWWQIISFDWF